jgi:hypothetical protein
MPYREVCRKPDLLFGGPAHEHHHYETWLFPEREYTFKHALTHEVAYSSLLQERERGYEAHALSQLGAVHAHADPPEAERAETHYQQALTLAEALGMRPLQAHCHRGLGMLYAKTDQRQQAHAELSTAIALYRDMDMTFWLPQAETALMQVSGC